MGRLYTHNSLRDAKEQFEIMFINDVLQDNEYSLRKSAETLGMHYSGLHRKMRHLGMPKTYRRTSKWKRNSIETIIKNYQICLITYVASPTIVGEVIRAIKWEASEVVNMDPHLIAELLLSPLRYKLSIKESMI